MPRINIYTSKKTDRQISDIATINEFFRAGKNSPSKAVEHAVDYCHRKTIKNRLYNPSSSPANAVPQPIASGSGSASRPLPDGECGECGSALYNGRCPSPAKHGGGL